MLDSEKDGEDKAPKPETYEEAASCKHSFPIIVVLVILLFVLVSLAVFAKAYALSLTNLVSISDLVVQFFLNETISAGSQIL